MKILKRLGMWLLNGFCGLGLLSAADSFVPEVVCKIDPTCRKMTDSEIAITQKVFGKKLDTSKIIIFERPVILHFIAGLFRGHVTLATVRGDNAMFVSTPAFLNKKFLEHARSVNPEEFADYNGVVNRRKFVHELAHLAQKQLKIPFNESVEAYTYEYEREPGKKFEDYGLEQQAEIVAGYFGLHSEIEQILKNNSLKATIRSGCSILKKDAQIFEPYFTPELPRACQPKTNQPKVS